MSDKCANCGQIRREHHYQWADGDTVTVLGSIDGTCVAYRPVTPAPAVDEAKPHEWRDGYLRTIRGGGDRGVTYCRKCRYEKQDAPASCDEMYDTPPVPPQPVVEERRYYPMICDKCKAGVQTNELSHRKRKCSCIGCGGNLQYITADEYFTLRNANSPHADNQVLRELVEAVKSEREWCDCDAPCKDCLRKRGRLNEVLTKASAALTKAQTAIDGSG